ncbi:MAG TPA: hypothetical protein PKD27_05630 [Tepidiformaceae bacterium]|nr:hypothetical protein [Tepidiformaceae bacterium]
MTVAGVVLIGLLPLGAHFVAFAALGNMPGGWLFGVRIRRIPGVQVGAAGHLVRWTHIGWQSTVIGLIALVVILPAFLAIKALTGGSPVPLAAEWKGVTLRIWVAPFTAAFLIYNLWRMAHADRGRTTWDVMTGTCAVHERREGPAAVPPVSQASGERTLR